MGWSSGSGLLSNIIETIKKNVDDTETREVLYRDIAEAFMDYDCDNLDECMGIDNVFDDYLKENGWEHLFEDEDDEL